MKKNIGKIIAVVVLVGILLVLSFVINPKTDPIKFKEEYETLNGKLNAAGTKVYSDLKLSKTNTVKYGSEEAIIDLIKNGTGVVYFGFPTCPWCRTMVPVLLELAEEENVLVHYLNISGIRSSYVLEEDETKAKLEYVGTDNYYILLELLDSYLEDYTLTNKAGEKIKTGEKRLFAPTVVFVKEGEIVGVHVGTVDSQEDPYVALTKEQKSELKNIYLDYMNKIQ